MYKKQFERLKDLSTGKTYIGKWEIKYNGISGNVNFRDKSKDTLQCKLKCIMKQQLS